MAAAPALHFSVWRKIAMATWRPRTDPMIFASLDVDAGNLLAYLDEVRLATGQHVTPAHLVGRAVAKVLEQLPGLNGRVVFGEFLPSPTIDIFYVVSLRTDLVDGADAAETDLSGSVIRRADEKPPWVQAAELTEKAHQIRAGEDPMFRQTKALAMRLPAIALRPILDTVGFITESLQLPVPFLGLEARPFGSFLVTNVGTYGLDSAYAAIATTCHVPGGVVVGAITEKPVVRNHEVVVRPILPLGAMIDHRFIDGYQGAVIAKIMREYLGDPAAFDPVPVPAAMEELPPLPAGV
ncbi:MAG: 2-oxo acid dehydrogenase subunit E2 [Acidimicrobiales bacterium]|nr:2-oxo acid dehydrogenase subunit E2 [Acidimicrobiales bacterium]